MQKTLLAEINEFLAETGMGKFRFGVLSVNNGRLLERLESTEARGVPSRLWPTNERKIRDFMAVHRHERSKQGAAA